MTAKKNIQQMAEEGPNGPHPLPMTPGEVNQRGWEAVDVVFVTGDAHVDHPSFAMAILGRVIEAEGFRVAILSQPDWRSCRPWRAFGRPRLCFAVSAGNMDSMLNHYTASRKVRNDDAYSPGGRIGLRPDRATLAYCQRAREAYHGVPVIAGGVEASLRRIAHYDYWSDKVRRSILLDAKADLLVYGMGERPLVEILHRLSAGECIGQLHDVRGTAYRLGARASLPEWRAAAVQGPHPSPATEASPRGTSPVAPVQDDGSGTVVLPGYDEVRADKRAFAEMTRLAYRESDPHGGRRLVQYHGREAVVVNPPALPLDEAELDRIYGLPFTRRPHPSYGETRIPAFEVVKDSVQIMRGCFGGCSFCSLSAHQGRIVQSRSEASVLAELHAVAGAEHFKGTISDLGGPTANMYRMNCTRPEVRVKCRRTSCLYPNICTLLCTDHGPLIRLMKAARGVPGIRHVLIASGVRMDLAARSAAYVNQLVRHHTGGLLKVAPEHTEPDVLRCMHKPPIEVFTAFGRQFQQAAAGAGKELYLTPYLMAGHPGCDLHAMIHLAQFLKRHNMRPEQVQDFIPAPMDLATCMYYAGIDPISGKEVHVPRGARQRRLQRALLQYFMPENYGDVRRALEQAGRTDLIGDGPHCLISTRRPATHKSRVNRAKHGSRRRARRRP